MTRDDAATGVIGIFGAGKSATALARRALAAGYTVRIATAAPATETAMMLDIVAPGAHATDATQMAEGADLVLIAVPLRRFRELPLESLAGHVVIDLMNYWPPVDGILQEFEELDGPTSVYIRDALPDSAQLVKTFNHLGYHQMEDLARPAGDPERAAVAVAGDDPRAVGSVAEFVDRVGFDAVVIGRLEASRAMQPDTAIFGRELTAAQLRQRLSAAERLVA